MIALLGGLGAALAWAVSTLCSSRSSRMIRPASVLAWVALSGLVVNLAVVAAEPRPHSLSGADVVWLVVSGAGNVAGLLLIYSALRHGKVGLVAPITSTEGAIAAVIAVVAGETLGLTSILLLAVITAGVMLASVAREERPVPGERKSLSVALALCAALAFGAGLYATGRLGGTLPAGWAVLPPRIVGVIAVTVPLALTRRLTITRAALPLVVTAGVAEVVGFLSFAAGARHGLAVTAVLSSQFAAVASVAAYFLFRERLTRLQLCGVVVIVAGVAALTAVHAA